MGDVGIALRGLHLAIPHGPEVTSITVGAAWAGIMLALAVGWYSRKLLQAERDVDSLRARLKRALELAWAARRAMAAVAVLVFVAVDLWFRGKGR